jgi:radical SAM superfamily enzyme YgiQ (UPF0313 family)
MDKNIKIELIIPPNPYLGDDKRNPPLGLLYLASVLENQGCSPRVVDLRGKNIKDFHSEIGEADIYGITASTPDYPLSLKIASIAKLKNKNAWVVLGGVHATALPHTIGREFDKIVIGEGERAFQELLEDFCKGNNEKRFYKSTRIEDLDSIPFPARHLLPFDSVFSRNAFSVGGDHAGTIITSRGCPFDCSFCASEIMWSVKVVYRSPENVESEIRNLIEEYGIRSFRFQDDTMTLNKERFERLCEKITPLGIKWRTTTRVDIASLEVLKMMKKAGCEEVGYGIESLSQEVLDKNAKKINITDAYTAVKNTKKAGLKSRLFFIIGLPGEQPGFAQRLGGFIEKTDPDGVDVSTMVPYPGSPIYHNPERFGIKLKTKEFDYYHMTLGFKGDEMKRPLIFVHDVMTEEQILEEREKSFDIVRKKEMVKNF